MVYVLKACADQAEAINLALPGGVKDKGYSIFDILPKGEESLKEKRYRDGLGNGAFFAISPLIPQNSAVFKPLQTVAWKGLPNVFGNTVGFMLLLGIVHRLIFCLHKFLNPVMVQCNGSSIGRFLKEIKNIYTMVCTNICLSLIQQRNKVAFYSLSCSSLALTD